MSKKPNKLLKEQLQNIEHHTCEVTDEDYKRIEYKIKLLERLAEVERSMYAVYDMSKDNYLLASAEQKKLFGEEQKGKNQNYGTAILYQNIHPDDLHFVLETDSMVYRFFSQLPSAEKKDYKLVYNFRVKNTEGFYRHYIHQSIILEQDKNGRAWLVLIITDLLSEQVTDKRLQRRMINMKTGKLHLFNDQESNSELLLTKRETEVLSLIERGYDSKNISNKLCISVNTVNNHRQNILRKTGTENTTQALIYARRLWII